MSITITAISIATLHTNPYVQPDNVDINYFFYPYNELILFYNDDNLS